jgi:NadR type nicotinamide-nucleotide adenylyltransferase
VATVDAPNRGGLTVAIVGAECSGKTTLAESLARRFDAPWVPEFAREYLAGRRQYDAADVIAIAKGQQAAESDLTRADDLLFVDTDLLVIKIWWANRFTGSDAWLDAFVNDVLTSARRRRYLLTTPDIPWHADPLRENPHDRPELHAQYRRLLDALGVEYVEIRGTPDERLQRASEAVTSWLNP